MISFWQWSNNNDNHTSIQIFISSDDFNETRFLTSRSITGRTTFPMLEDSKRPHISLPQNCLIAEIWKLNFKVIDRTFLEYFAYKASIKTNKFSDLHIKPRFYCIFCSCSARFARWEHQPILSIHLECLRNLSNLQKRTENCFLIFGGHKSFLWSHWCHCFGLLMTSAPGFKARVDLLPSVAQHSALDESDIPARPRRENFFYIHVHKLGLPRNVWLSPFGSLWECVQFNICYF